jgi:hypothetical protein
MWRIFFIMVTPFLVTWAVSMWWQMRRARSARERSLLSRATLGGTIALVLTIIALTFLPVRGVAVALPIAVIAGIIYYKSVKAERERIRAEESDPDPVARARKIN